jgi:hypothetical protein
MSNFAVFCWRLCEDVWVFGLVSFGFVLFRFVSFRFVSFGLVWFGLVRFGLVYYRVENSFEGEKCRVVSAILTPNKINLLAVY